MQVICVSEHNTTYFEEKKKIALLCDRMFVGTASFYTGVTWFVWNWEK